MQILYDRIRKDGIVRAGNVLKVDRFLNHQMDIHLFQEIGKEFKRRFEGEEINKILTIEASGIGIACIVAEYFDVPVVFATNTSFPLDGVIARPTVDTPIGNGKCMVTAPSTSLFASISSIFLWPSSSSATLTVVTPSASRDPM